MDRSQKEKAVADFKKIFDESEAVIVTHYKGINADSINDLRAQTRDSNVSFRVTKNRLIKIALKGGVYENISDLFTGPTAIAYSNDVVSAAKVTNAFAKKNESLIIVGGALKDQVLDLDGIKHLASLPSLPELQAKILGLINAPARQIATIVAAPAKQIITVTQAYEGVKEVA
jgi:large subunit ribosomal protein L10